MSISLEPIMVAHLPTTGASLDRAFRAIIFDWDGTAVSSRTEDVAPLAVLVEGLLHQGAWVVVVTGTRFDYVDRQLCQLITPGQRRRLLVCTNRGSEVYGFNTRGKPVRRWLHQSTPAEETALTAIAERGVPTFSEGKPPLRIAVTASLRA